MWKNQIPKIMSNLNLLSNLSEGGENAALACGLAYVDFPDDLLKDLYFSGKSLVSQGSYSKAQDVFAFLCMVRNVEPHYWNALGVSLFLDKQYDLAETSLGISQRLNCLDLRTYYHRGLCLMHLQRNTEALEQIEQAIEKTENLKAYEPIHNKCKRIRTKMKEL